MKKKFLLIIFFVSIILFTFFNKKVMSEEQTELSITPQLIKINTFFKGTDLEIRGSLPPSCEAVVLVKGLRTEISFHTKGKVGPFWMNTGSITFKNVPIVYNLMTSAQLKEISSIEDLLSNTLGYDALFGELTIISKKEDKKKYFHDFIVFEEAKKLFSFQENIIKIENENDTYKFITSLPITTLVPTGTYTVSLYCFKNKSLISKKESKFSVVTVGWTKFISNLAFKHSAIYGVLAIFVALIVGLLMSFVFGSRKSGRH